MRKPQNAPTTGSSDQDIMFWYSFFVFLTPGIAGSRRDPEPKKNQKFKFPKNMETKNLNFAETRCDLAQFWKPRSHGAEATDKWRDQTTIEEHPDPPGFPHVKLMKTPPEDSIHCISLRRGAR